MRKINVVTQPKNKNKIKNSIRRTKSSSISRNKNNKSSIAAGIGGSIVVKHNNYKNMFKTQLPNTNCFWKIKETKTERFWFQTRSTGNITGDYKHCYRANARWFNIENLAYSKLKTWNKSMVFRFLVMVTLFGPHCRNLRSLRRLRKCPKKNRRFFIKKALSSYNLCQLYTIFPSLSKFIQTLMKQSLVRKEQERIVSKNLLPLVRTFSCYLNSSKSVLIKKTNSDSSKSESPLIIIDATGDDPDIWDI